VGGKAQGTRVKVDGVDGVDSSEVRVAAAHMAAWEGGHRDRGSDAPEAGLDSATGRPRAEERCCVQLRQKALCCCAGSFRVNEERVLVAAVHCSDAAGGQCGRCVLLNALQCIHLHIQPSIEAFEF
jgi:hypothetical protein